MIISYLRYLRKAQGKYRLHSPLVFELYEKVLAPSTSFRAKRSGVEKSSEELFYDALDKKLKDFVKDNPLIFKDNDTVMIVKDIHRGRQDEADWEKLISCDNVRLSIDCWRFGIVFFMDRLIKEHFVLKI